MPRKRDETARRRRNFVEAIQRGQTVSEAAESAGVARSTPYAWEREDENFAREWAQARETRFAQWTDAAHDLALNGSELMLRFLITRHDRELQSQRSRGERVITEVIISPANLGDEDDGNRGFITIE